MKLSQFAITEIIPYILGDKSSNHQKGRDLVNLFNRVNFQDVYDLEAGGLPKIHEGLNTSRRDYTKDRLDKINGTERMRTLIRILIDEAGNKENMANSIEQIISNEGYRISLVDGIVSIKGGINEKGKNIVNEVLFREYEAQLLEELNSAKVSILVAVAWISNERLVSKLIEKHNAGIDVKIIVNKDGTNKKYSPEFGNINIYAKRGDNGGIMHNKFCVIDNQVVIHGSYNWSNNAEFKNDETLEITKGDNEKTSEFSVKFMNLLKNSQPFV